MQELMKFEMEAEKRHQRLHSRCFKGTEKYFIGPLASGRTNRKATTSILTTDYPGIKRSPNNYSSDNGIEKLLYLSLSNIKFKVVTPQTAAEEIHGESKSS